MTPTTPASLTFTVAGTPRPKERPRIVGNHAYTPKRTRQWERDVAWSAIQAMQEAGLRRPVFDGPVRVTITTFGAHPRADADNLAKAILDACTTARVWKDDSYILRLKTNKERPRDESPRRCAIVKIVALPDADAA